MQKQSEYMSKDELNLVVIWLLSDTILRRNPEFYSKETLDVLRCNSERISLLLRDMDETDMNAVVQYLFTEESTLQ